MDTLTTFNFNSKPLSHSQVWSSEQRPLMSPCSDRRYETRKDSQRNQHLSDTRLELRLFLSVLDSGLHCHGVSDGTVLERSSFRSSLLTSGTSAHSIDSHCANLVLAGCGTCQAPLPCCEWTFHSLRDWAHVGVVLWELPTASSHFGSSGVLWVLTGTHPCGPPSRMMEVTRAPALVDCGVWSWCCCQVVL